ncbi:MAG: hypothetical protein RL227_2826 [Pseudomonadota bacterium]|jgi:hypothetical protein
MRSTAHKLYRRWAGLDVGRRAAASYSPPRRAIRQAATSSFTCAVDASAHAQTQQIFCAHSRGCQPELGRAHTVASLKTGASEFRQQHEQQAALRQRAIDTGADASGAPSQRRIMRR